MHPACTHTLTSLTRLPLPRCSSLPAPSFLFSPLFAKQLTFLPLSSAPPAPPTRIKRSAAIEGETEGRGPKNTLPLPGPGGASRRAGGGCRGSFDRLRRICPERALRARPGARRGRAFGQREFSAAAPALPLPGAPLRAGRGAVPRDRGSAAPNPPFRGTGARPGGGTRSPASISLPVFFPLV